MASKLSFIIILPSQVEAFKSWHYSRHKTRGHQTRDNTCPVLISYLVSSAISSILILCLHVEDVLHVELEWLGAPGPHHPRPLVHLEPAPGWNVKKIISTAVNLYYNPI